MNRQKTLCSCLCHAPRLQDRTRCGVTPCCAVAGKPHLQLEVPDEEYPAWEAAREFLNGGHTKEVR